jgi:hypothetical protein
LQGCRPPWCGRWCAERARSRSRRSGRSRRKALRTSAPRWSPAAGDCWRAFCAPHPPSGVRGPRGGGSRAPPTTAPSPWAPSGSGPSTLRPRRARATSPGGASCPNPSMRRFAPHRQHSKLTDSSQSPCSSYGSASSASGSWPSVAEKRTFGPKARAAPDWGAYAGSWMPPSENAPYRKVGE